MIPAILAIALYILAKTEASLTDEDVLTVDEWKSLQTEYFLQQLIEQLLKELKDIIQGVAESELSDIINNIKVKN